ncbi:MAG: class I SAM-dependent methyltransferase [Pseudomonadota bacterium]
MSPNSDADRIAREKDFHNKRFENDHEHEDRQAQEKYYAAISDCFESYAEKVEELAVGADVLEYGCSNGDRSLQLAARSNSITGIDISDVAIERANRLALDQGVENATFLAMNAEEMTFDDASFDLVFGSGILHHLDLEKSLSEIRRVLRPGGRAVFVEPLGHNPVFNAYRMLTPNARSVDEHPLLKRDFKLFDTILGDGSHRFFGLGTLAVVPFRNTALKAPLFGVTRTIDRGLLALPGVKWGAWYALMEGTAA